MTHPPVLIRIVDDDPTVCEAQSFFFVWLVLMSLVTTIP